MQRTRRRRTSRRGSSTTQGSTPFPPTATTLAGRPAHTLRTTLHQDYLPLYDPAHPATLGCSLPADCIMLAETADHL